MNVARLRFAFSVLSALLAMSSASAFASEEEPSSRFSVRTLDAMLAATEDPVESVELPTQLNLWSAEPQGRQSHQTPFIDFSHFEMGVFAGVAAYSTDFKANPSFLAGISARVPVPGIPLGDWGIFAEGFVSYISRDLPFYYNNRSGTWFGGEAGGDYTFIRDSVWYLRAQVGILYAYWNKVNALDNGVGILGGVEVGFYWIKHNNQAVVTINPQISYDGSNWIGIVTIGLSYDF
jgi:hypothetical protein